MALKQIENIISKTDSSLLIGSRWETDFYETNSLTTLDVSPSSTEACLFTAIGNATPTFGIRTQASPALEEIMQVAMVLLTSAVQAPILCVAYILIIINFYQQVTSSVMIMCTYPFTADEFSYMPFYRSCHDIKPSLPINPHETARYGEIASAILNFFVCCMEMG